MPHDTPLIATIVIALSLAWAFGALAHRLRLPPIVGYLIAGVAIGPHTPGFIADPHVAEQFADIGVILLMFGVGLQFHVEELLEVRRIAIPGAIVQSGVATIVGALAAHAFGWTWPAAVEFGLCLSLASTVVLVRVLSDRRQLHTDAGHIAVGWLVVQDILAVLVLVLLPALRSGASAGALALSVALAIVTLQPRPRARAATSPIKQTIKISIARQSTVTVAPRSTRPTRNQRAPRIAPARRRQNTA